MIECVAVDDEPLAIELLSEHLSRIPYVHLKASFNSPFEAMLWMNNNPADLLFIDMEMPGLNGIQFLKSIKSHPMVIVTSAYNQYAIDGFQLDVLDYLLKPYAFERLLKAVNKAWEYYHLRQSAQEKTETNTLNDDAALFVKSDYKTVKIFLRDILFIEGLKDYVKIHLGNGKTIVTLLGLKQLEANLPIQQFLRVHRSYIVSLSKIDCIERGRIRIGSHEVPLSDSFKDAFFSRIKPIN